MLYHSTPTSWPISNFRSLPFLVISRLLPYILYISVLLLLLLPIRRFSTIQYISSPLRLPRLYLISVLPQSPFSITLLPRHVLFLPYLQLHCVIQLHPQQTQSEMSSRRNTEFVQDCHTFQNPSYWLQTVTSQLGSSRHNLSSFHPLRVFINLY